MSSAGNGFGIGTPPMWAMGGTPPDAGPGGTTCMSLPPTGKSGQKTQYTSTL